MTRLSEPRRRAQLTLAAAFLGLLALGFFSSAVAAQDPSGSGVPASAVATASAVASAAASPGAAPSASSAASAPAVASPSAAPGSSPEPSGPSSAPSVEPGPSNVASPTPVGTAPCPNVDPSPTPSPLPGQTPGPASSPLPHNLCPAQPGSDPLSTIAWIFTPLFQAIFMVLALFYNLTHDIGFAIILVTLLIRFLLVPIFRAQIVSQRRMQMLQPELRAISTKWKGNRAKISEEQMKLYKERGYNPASGCLPSMLQLLLLLPMYQVFSQGLSAPNIDSMLTVFGTQVIHVTCYDPTNPYAPCINPIIPWLFNLDAHKPEILFYVVGFGVSLLAIISALLQLVQTRMMQPPTDDPQASSQQRIFLILPLFSLIYGALLPAGLFIYWITTTIFSIVQQFLIAGFGGLFPLFGWTPPFAVGHQPRFPVKPLTPRAAAAPTDGGQSSAQRRSAAESAAGTIKPARTRARTSRRGRRR
jgi:YidC/Oxa1 family membrane protein insertase